LLGAARETRLGWPAVSRKTIGQEVLGNGRRAGMGVQNPSSAHFLAQIYTGCQKRLPKCRAWKRRVQGVTREWMNILDRGITPELGFPRRNLNTHARAAARVPFPLLSHFRKNFWQSVCAPFWQDIWGICKNDFDRGPVKYRIRPCGNSRGRFESRSSAR